MTTAQDRAEALYAARRDRRPIEPFTDADPAMTADDAYEVQTRFASELLADGDAISGYKLGLTSKAMQQMMGISAPDYGPVLHSMVHDGALDTDSFIRPRAEAEIALVLDRPLAGPNVTNIEAARAVGGAVAAIEVVDSRIADWRIRLADTISDLASIGGVVLGSRIVPVDFDLRLVGMTFSLNGSIVATGAGAAALGNPITALAWLANTLAPHGVTLEPGMFIMTGALHAAVDVDAGDVVRADFDRLGPVSLRMA
ncbi:MAG: fumarylacetoacetate hydrolase family protein [bacterium]|nr:fumarylacetoacetate hydrolase family protein [bacterium]MDE0290638.1 fumarylacetoacetate hydrolase family protein [bacterium]MDE0439090.1 fumarylacetoacetate hydrolase family protein [bacterium]